MKKEIFFHVKFRKPLQTKELTEIFTILQDHDYTIHDLTKENFNVFIDYAAKLGKAHGYTNYYFLSLNRFITEEEFLQEVEKLQTALNKYVEYILPRDYKPPLQVL